MPGGPQNVGAEDLPGVEGLVKGLIIQAACPLGNSPFGRRIILGLDGSHPAYDLSGPVKFLPADVLVVQAPGRDRFCIQWDSLRTTVLPGFNRIPKNKPARMIKPSYN